MVTWAPEWMAIAAALVSSLAEIAHYRRLQQVKWLAFGPTGRAAAWVAAMSLLRVLALSAAVWGFASLWLAVDARVHNEAEISDSEYKHLVLVVDVSPSMHLMDAGLEGKISRRQRASDILESLFNRIPMRQFKVTIIAVYTDAKMLLEDSQDHEVVRHIMEKMPMWHAYKPGKTKLISGIIQAAKVAKPWRPRSTYVLILTDGDTVPATGMPTMPASVAEVLVLGVGSSTAGSFIDGHQSRQDVNTLRQIANRLRGWYHNGNERQLPSQLVGKFARAQDQSINDRWTRREWALLAALVGSACFASIPILLHYCGTHYLPGTAISSAA